jgi:hypothetical protein
VSSIREDKEVIHSTRLRERAKMNDPVVRGEPAGPGFLLVEGSTAGPTFHGRILEKFGPVDRCTLDAAAAVLASNECSGLLFGDGLHDGSAIAFARRLRALDPVRVMQLGGRPTSRALALLPDAEPDEQLRADAASLLATVIVLPGTVAAFEQFARQALASLHLDTAAAMMAGQLAHQHALSAMETRILALEVGTVPRPAWGRILGVGPSTIRTYVDRILVKSGASTLKELAAPTTQALLTGEVLGRK